MFKLSPITFIVCGIVLIAVTWAGFWFLSMDKTKQEIASYEEYISQLDEIISPQSVRMAEQRVESALQKVYDAQLQWKQVASLKTPSAGRINLTPHRYQLTVNTRNWHGTVEKDLRDWIRKSGVRVLAPINEFGTGPFVPFPTDRPNELVNFYFNYPALPFPVCVWDLGEITVEGTLDQILSHVRSWNNIPGYIALARGLAITGSGNRLRGTYGLTVVAYVNTEFVFGGNLDQGGIPDMSTASGQGGTQTGSGTMERPSPTGGTFTGSAPGGGAIPPAAGGGAGGGQPSGPMRAGVSGAG